MSVTLHARNRQDKSWPAWLPEVAALLLLAAAATAMSHFTDFDIRAQRLFFHPNSPDSWPMGGRAPWLQIYRYGTIPAIAVAGGAMIVVLRGLVKEGSRLRRFRAMFLLLAMLAGPVGLVNGVFKTYWGRPRPRDVVQFGGEREYVPAMAMGTWRQGRSFPCGHATMGFYLGAFYFLLSDRRRGVAFASLGVSAAAGTLIGVARMAAGAHFASDVAWAAVMTYGPMLVLHRWIMRIPVRERAGAPVLPEPAKAGWRMTVLILLVSLVAVLALLLSTPFERHSVRAVALPNDSTPMNVGVKTRDCGLEIVIARLDKDILVAEEHASGFGLPWNSVKSVLKQTEYQGCKVARFNVAPKGVFTELAMNMRLSLSGGIRRVEASITDEWVTITYHSGPVPEIHAVVRNGRLRVDPRLAPHSSVNRLPDGRTECTVRALDESTMTGADSRGS